MRLMQNEKWNEIVYLNFVSQKNVKPTQREVVLFRNLLVFSGAFKTFLLFKTFTFFMTFFYTSSTFLPKLTSTQTLFF